MAGHVTTPAAALAERPPSWATLVRAANPGPMTLDGTNTWVLRDPAADRALVVDPGPLDEDHLASVAAVAPAGWVVLTHGHPDHAEGLDRFVRMTGAAVLPVRPNHVVAGLSVRIIGTPGHTADSCCLHVSTVDGGEPAMLTGDTILGRGTTVVAWPDGNLDEYLGSLRVLAGFDGIPVLPGHGPALADCAAAAHFYLTHRLARLDQVRAARDGGARSAVDIVAIVYADLARALWPAAELSVRAQLDYLEVQR